VSTPLHPRPARAAVEKNKQHVNSMFSRTIEERVYTTIIIIIRFFFLPSDVINAMLKNL